MATAEKQTPIVEHFDSFEIKDGKFLGYAHGQPFEVKEIRNEGTGTTYVTYKQDDEWLEIVQHSKVKFVNRREYG
jgi:hypothetical protein